MGLVHFHKFLSSCTNSLSFTKKHGKNSSNMEFCTRILCFQIDPKIFFKDFNWSSVWARGSASHPEGTCPWRVLEETLRLKCWRHRGNCSWVPRRRQHSNSVSFRFSQGWRPGYRQHNRAERNPFHTIGEVTFTFAKNCVVSSALLCRNLGPTIRKRAFWVNIRCSDGPVLAVRREWSCAVLLILPSLFHSTLSETQKRLLDWKSEHQVWGDFLEKYLKFTFAIATW